MATVKTYTVAPDMLDDAGFATMLDALARGLEDLEALAVPGVVAVGEVEIEVVGDDDDDDPDNDPWLDGAIAAQADRAKAEEPDGPPEMSAEEAAFHAEVEASDPGGGESYPGDANDPGRYVPPVDDDGFQCGLCLLNRRQCLACARREAEDINATLDLVTSDDAGKWVRYAGNVTTVEDEHDRAMAHEYLASLPDWERLIRREYRQCAGPLADAAVEAARQAGRS